MRRDLMREHGPFEGVMTPTPSGSAFATHYWESLLEFPGGHVTWDWWGLYVHPVRNGGQLYSLDEVYASFYFEPTTPPGRYNNIWYGRPVYLGENDEVWWVAISYTGYDYDVGDGSGFVASALAVWSIDKSTYEAVWQLDYLIDVETGLDVDGDSSAESYYPPALAMWEQTTGVVAWGVNEYLGDAVGWSKMWVYISSFDFDLETGVVSNIQRREQHLSFEADQYETSVHVIWGDSPLVTDHGIAFPITSSPWGVPVTRPPIEAQGGPSNRASCYVMTVDPDTWQVSQVQLAGDDEPSYMGSMCIGPAPDGFVVCVTPHRYDYDSDTDPYWEDYEFMTAVQGDWQLQYWHYTGGTPTHLSTAKFRNWSYMNKPSVYTPRNDEWYGVIPTLCTFIVGGPSSGVLLTWWNSQALRVYDWSINGNTVSVTQRGYWMPWEADKVPWSATREDMDNWLYSSHAHEMSGGWRVLPADIEYLVNGYADYVSIYFNALNLPDELPDVPAFYSALDRTQPDYKPHTPDEYDVIDWP